MALKHHWKKTCATLLLGAVVAASSAFQSQAAETEAAKNDGLVYWKLAKSYQEIAIGLTDTGGQAADQELAQSFLTPENQILVLSEPNSMWNFASQMSMDVLDLLSLNPDADPLSLPAGSELKIAGEAAPEQLKALKATVKIPVRAQLALAAPSQTDAIKPSEALQKNGKPQASEPKKTTEKKAVKKPAAKPASAAAKSGQKLTTAAGKQVQYKKVLNIKASAYSADPSENGGYAGIDYYGNKLTVGTIAVDPKVIPLGSTVYVTGYAFPGLPAKGMIAKATDIGGAIKGNRIDIFVPGSKEKVNNFGYQSVKVYILK
ncbi:3D domain-containing protein [Paenibacillus sp. UNC499MF]|uniref:3D domain-containing protein n=1 Tax=Paenibacillus sp. UNC499MF TaxID=1502751 RepID=UPI0008A07657|nr:3D domain-containing protein [Paenibacillus sp. UNC499MF]SEG74610.1 3D (Asp-Asp-Asp) domain-containing protein [Paenibacillus sp. UNC499MF]